VGEESKDAHRRRLSVVNQEIEGGAASQKQKRGSDWWENADNVLFGNPSLPGKAVSSASVPPPPPPDAGVVRGVRPSKDKDALMSISAREISKSLREDEEDDEEDVEDEGQDESQYVSELGKMCALDHDIVVWMGDLNYRIDVSMDIKEVYVRRSACAPSPPSRLPLALARAPPRCLLTFLSRSRMRPLAAISLFARARACVHSQTCGLGVAYARAHHG
jgi:hypothetical protein